MTKIEAATYYPMIIPTIVIPFTVVLAALSAAATFIAGLFGIQLKAEGPKKLLEVLMKPRVLVAAFFSNIILIAAVKGFYYWKDAPVMLSRIESKQRALAKPSSLLYPDNVSNGETMPASIPSPTAKTTESLNGSVTLVWSRKLGAASFRGAVASANSAFVGMDNGYIQEIDLATGEARRDFYVGTAVSGLVRVHDGALIAGEGTHDIHHARVYKFDLASGRLVGTFTSQGHIEAEVIPASWQNKTSLLVSTGAGGIVSLNPQTLDQQWQFREGHIDAAARVVDKTVFVGTGREKENIGGSKGVAFAIDLLSGKKLWQQELPASTWMRPIAVKDRVCFVFGEVYFHSDLGGFYCFMQRDGTPDIAYNNAAPIVSEPVLLDDDVITADLQGKVCRVSLRDGLAKWCRSTGKAAKAFANPVYDPKFHLLVYPSEKEGVLVMDPANGHIVTTWKGDGRTNPWAPTLAPMVITEDGWLVVDMGGNLRKLRWDAEPQKILHSL
jgi:outer membrane protein assembly factor BamB